MSFIKSKLQTAINNNMKNTFKTLLFISLLCGVSGADEIKSVSVMEGDSVTLQTDENKILTYNQIRWRFGVALIAEIPDDDNINLSGATVRFRGRLKLDNLTGSLTITNTRTIHSGAYKIQIISSNAVPIEKKFTLTVYDSPPVIDPDRTEVKSVEVMEGESVSLNTDIIKPHGDELIVWRFGDILIAKVDKENNKISLSPDERFRDRIHLDQTGSLIISNSRTADTGEYKLKISSNRETIYKRFSLTVKDSPSVIDPDTTEVKSESVIVGESVSLNTDINPLGDELIVWRFGDILIAKDDKENKISLYPDERFKYRIHLDQTGSLIINNITTAHTGEYKLKISSNNREPIYKRFSLYVKVPPPPPMSAAAAAGITVAVLLVAAAVAAVGVFYYLRRISKLERLNDQYRTVFVMERDPVTLITDDAHIKTDKVNVYHGDTLIAEIRRGKITYVKDVFRERLKLNHQTGSLIISNSRRTDSGVYKLKISICTKEITFKTIIVHVIDDEGISQTVMKGKSFYLLIGVPEIQKDAEVELKFENTVIAHKKQTDKMISLHQNAHDGIFRQNLHVEKTGSLFITDIRPDQSGDYELNITSSRVTVHHIIRVSVSDISKSVSPTLPHGKAREYIINPVTEGDSGPSRAVAIDEGNESVSLMMK